MKTIEYIIFIILLNSCGAYAENTKLNQCDVALNSCRELVIEEAKYISTLKGQLKDMEGRAAPSENHPIIWALVGFIAGGAVYTVVNGTHAK